MDWDEAKRALLEGKRVRAVTWLPGVCLSQEQGRLIEHRTGLVPRITGDGLDDNPFLRELRYEEAR